MSEDLRLAEIEKRMKAAVFGPWHAGRTVGRTIYHGEGPDDLIGIMDSRPLADFVANAPDDITYLLGRVRELEAEKIAQQKDGG
jgi:hypothetical protein